MQETVDRSLESEDGKVAVNCTQYGYDYVYSIPGGSKTTAFAYRSYFSNVYLNNRKLTIQSDISFNGTASGWINIPCYIDALWNKYVYVGKTSLHSTDYYPRAMLSVQIEKGSVGSIYVFLEVKSNNHADLYTGVEKEQLDDEQQYGGKINSIKFGLDFYNKVIVTRYKPDAYLF